MAPQSRSIMASVIAWFGAGLAGWILFRFLLTISSDGRLRQVFLGMAIVAAVVIGYGVVHLLRKRHSLSADGIRSVSLGANWATGSACGWNIAVFIGGPITGLATTIFANRLFENRIWLMSATIIGAIVVGRMAMELPGGTEVFSGGAWCAAAIAAYTFIVVRLFDDPALAFKSAITVAWWAFAWVAAFWVKNVVGMPNLAGYGVNSLELVIGFGIGGAMANQPWFSVGTMARWTLGGLVAALVGIVIDFGLTLTVSGPGALLSGQPQFLDAGQIVGFGLGAMFATRLVRATRDGAA